MAFTDLTSTASVRAVLGVSERELRDDILLDPIFAVELTEALYDIHLNLFGDFKLAAATDPRTSLQQRFVDLAQTFAAYHIAKQCLGSVAMFAPKVIKDSRSELQRSDDPYKNLRIDVPASLALLRTRLRMVYAQINPDATIPTSLDRIRLVATPLGINPVTGA
jgi:hypothetical protein